MSLSFLSKKPWHVTTVRNVEKVWLAEEKQKDEEKRLLELKKQIDEEREIDELRALQRDNGLVTDPKQKVEWMYEGPGSAVASSAAAEEYKLGKAYVPSRAKSELGKLEDKSAAGSLWLDEKANDANEQFVRVNEDPLYAMRRSEKRERDKHVLKNPLAMKRIQQSLASELREYEQKKRTKKQLKKAKKEAKKAKKKKHSKKKKKHTSQDSDDSSDDDRPLVVDAGVGVGAASTDEKPPPPPNAANKPEGYGLTKGQVKTERELGPSRELLEARRRDTARPPRREKGPKLDDDELARLRDEMARDGQTHEARRVERMRDHRKTAVQECLEEDADILRKRKRDLDDDDDDDDLPSRVDPSFLRQTKSAAFGQDAHMNLTEALQRGRNRHQKKVGRASAADFFDE